MLKHCYSFFFETFNKKSTAFWVVMPCSSETVHHFKGIYFLHLEGRRVSQGRNQHNQAAKSASAGFLHGLLFDLGNTYDTYYSETMIS
jgi:hypothetical protein